MHPAEPAGRHEPDPRGAADGESAADGSGSDGALHDGDCKVARADLACGRVEALELGRGESDADLPVEHADRGRHRTAVAHGSFRFAPDLDSLSGWKPVRDQRGLESDDSALLAKRLHNLVGDDHGIAPSRAQQRAAASRPSLAPPTRKPAARASPAPVVSTTSVAAAG